MPKIDVTVPHELGQNAAIERIQKLVSQVKAQFADRVSNVRETWKENVGEFQMTVMGFDVSGVIHVESDQIRMKGQIPFAALPFKGRIESAIRDKAKTLLA